MFDMSLLHDKKKQQEAGAVVMAAMEAINRTDKITAELLPRIAEQLSILNGQLAALQKKVG